MNLVDIINPERGLKQDKWSLEKPRFGKENQLEVIGWSGIGTNHKYYILKCDICSCDPELFGEGVFRSPKSSLLNLQLPYGCSRPKWSEDQYSILCRRKAQELGFTFLGWAAYFSGRDTKIKMFCEKHGEWCSGSIHNLTSHGRGCPKCGFELVAHTNRKPVDIMIQSFFDSGQFPEDTKFWKNDTRTDKDGLYDYWNVYCPECNTTAVSLTHTIQKGSRSCLCSRARQQEGYINWVVDENNQTIAIKFGIANIAKKRAYQQNWRCVYEVRNYLIYAFPDKTSCWAAERECKQTLVCGILTKEEMPDGYTETTDVLNLVKIKQIYEKHGGVKLVKEIYHSPK